MAKVCIACGEPVGKHRAKYCSAACGLAKRLERKRNKHNTDPEARRKQLVRLKCRYLKLERKPCFYCGSPETEKHHWDYDYPEVVSWLCRAHHIELHRHGLDISEDGGAIQYRVTTNAPRSGELFLLAEDPLSRSDPRPPSLPESQPGLSGPR
jgi:hypothetical protein